jgi:phage terminase large subunit-like protein
MQQSEREQKIQLLELLEEKERRRKADPLKYCERHPKQITAHEAAQAIRALFWGNRVGKTEWGAMEVSEYATLHHKHREMTAPFEIWAACPSFDVQEHTTQKKLMGYLPEKEIERIEYLRGKIIKKITLKNGVTIQFKSYEQGREKFQGAGVRLIWFDEEPPKDIWEESFVRVEAGQQLDVILTMTAVKGMTWVYDQIYLDTANPDLFISEAGWDDNPYLTEDQKAQMARGLSENAIKVRREGKFVKRVGLVAAWWERDQHIKHYVRSIEQVKTARDVLIAKNWTWYEVLDPGWSDPAAWLLIGVDHDNNVHVVDGFRKKQFEKNDMKDLRDIKKSDLLIRKGWIDNNDPRFQQELAALKRADGTPNSWPLQAVQKITGDKKNWDETLAEKMEEYGKIQPGTGKPRLFISDTLTEINETTGVEVNWMVQEIENLVWLEHVSKTGEEIKPEWDDHRKFGHHFDGMRALAYFLISYMKPKDDERDIPVRSNNVSSYWNS